jgi:hypothetical protein
VQRAPRGPHLDLVGLDRIVDQAERQRRGPGDGAAGGGVLRPAAGQRVGEPAPADLRERRVTGHVGIDVSADEGHDAGVASPAVLPCRVVQDDETTRRDLVVVSAHLGAEGNGVRREPAGRRDLVQLQDSGALSGSQCLVQALDGAGEHRGRGRRFEGMDHSTKVGR